MLLQLFVGERHFNSVCVTPCKRCVNMMEKRLVPIRMNMNIDCIVQCVNWRVFALAPEGGADCRAHIV